MDSTGAFPGNVVFIHGAWMTPASFDNFIPRFEAAGYTCHAPAWPFMERPLDELRSSPAPELGQLGIQHIVDHYEGIIRGLPDNPLLVGHSFGGLFVQLLLDRGFGHAGIAIDPAPFGGIFPAPSMVANVFPILSTFDGWDKLFPISPDDFARNFANFGTADEQMALYHAHTVPVPGRIFYQSATFLGTGLDPHRRTAPLLLIAGEEDRTVPPQVVHAEYSKQKNSPARTDLKSYPGRTHFQMAQPGWEQVCADCLAWFASLHGHSAAG